MDKKVEQVQKKHEEIMEEKLNESITNLGIDQIGQWAAEEKREEHLQEVSDKMKEHEQHVAQVNMRHKKSFEEAREEELAHLKVKHWKEDELLHRQRQERADQLLQQKQKSAEQLSKVELHHKELEEQTATARAACKSSLDKSLTQAEKIRAIHLEDMVSKVKEHDLHVNEVRERHDALCAEHEAELREDQEQHRQLHRLNQARTAELDQQKQKLADQLAKVELQHKELQEKATAAKAAACETALKESLTHADELREKHLAEMVNKLKEHDQHVEEVRSRHAALCVDHEEAEAEMRRNQLKYEQRSRLHLEKAGLKNCSTEAIQGSTEALSSGLLPCSPPPSYEAAALKR